MAQKDLTIVQNTTSDESFWNSMKLCTLAPIIGLENESIAHFSYQNYTSLTL